MDEFLRSKPMLTPGMAGGATTMITGTLVSQFGLPGDTTGLVVSFVLGLLVWADKTVPFLQRMLYYIINSIIIYAVAVGLNQAGVAITKSKAQVEYESRWVQPASEEKSFFQPWF